MDSTLLSGFYALHAYLPFSRLSRAIRAKTGRTPILPTRLPQVDWSQIFPGPTPRLVETDKRGGNVRLSELALLAMAAAECPEGGRIFEIGTFDGRTSLNMAWNAPASAQVFTLDLPEIGTAALRIEQGENYLSSENPSPGARFREGAFRQSAAAKKITQLRCDSAVFDPGELAGQCHLVFVDGSHSPEYATSDTDLALRLLAPGGRVIWHDYGVWPGVAVALEAFEAKQAAGLRHIAGTSLVEARFPGFPG